MPRTPRPRVENGIYHVYSRGNRRQPIFAGDGDSRAFLALLDDTSKRLGWRGHVFCLMPNHYHLVVETPNGDISAGMQRLNGVYAQWFNGTHGLDGHLFQGRFQSILVETDAHLLELARYLPLNPVRGGLCSHPAEWSWSSFRATVGLERPRAFLAPGRILRLFGPSPDEARRRFCAFVEAAPRGRNGT